MEILWFSRGKSLPLSRGILLLLFDGKFVLSLEAAIADCIVYRRKTLNSIAFEWEKIDERK